MCVNPHPEASAPGRAAARSQALCGAREAGGRAARPSPTPAGLSPNGHCDFTLFLLQEGFDALDPFVPILVSNYNRKEFESCIQYYLENSWLQHEKGP